MKLQVKRCSFTVHTAKKRTKKRKSCLVNVYLLISSKMTRCWTAVTNQEVTNLCWSTSPKETKLLAALFFFFFVAPPLFVLKALKCQTDNGTQTEAYFQRVADEKGLVLRSASEQVNMDAGKLHAGFCSRLACCASAVSVPGLGSEAHWMLGY